MSNLIILGIELYIFDNDQKLWNTIINYQKGVKIHQMCSDHITGVTNHLDICLFLSLFLLQWMELNYLNIDIK